MHTYIHTHDVLKNQHTHDVLKNQPVTQCTIQVHDEVCENF